jgi:hypothetical protein
MYFFAGMALVLTTVLLFKRLPQSPIQRIFTIIFLALFAAASGLCGYKTYTAYSNSRDFKQIVIETNRKYENQNFVTITDADITFIHKGKYFEATADLKIINENSSALDRYLFSLNPSLTVQKITSGGIDVKYSRTNQIIEIDRGKLLDPGMSDSVLISYSGTINESFCYPNYSDNMKLNPYRIIMMNVSKRQSFLEENYVLLTPETHWYPVTSLNYYPTNPAKIKLDFARYTLRVKTEPGLSSISQGRMTTENEYNIFKPESPLSGLTLVMGNYMSDTLRVDSIDYISYHFPGNDYYKKDLSELKDTLPTLVSGIMRELETNFSTRYPYKTLSLVEVPVQFYSYPKKNTQTRAEVQPSMVLLPEKLSTIDNAGFSKRFRNQKRRMARNNEVITDKELQVRIFNECFRNVFISGENYRWQNGVPLNEPTRYRLGPSFYFFKNNFYSSEYPVINAVFESHLQHLTTQEDNYGIRTGMGVLSDNDKANLILRNSSFRELLSQNPSDDTIRNILTVKGDWLFNLLRSRAGINEFKPWFSEYIDKNQFKNIDLRQFDNDIKEKFGFDFIPTLDSWFNSKEQPGFLFTNLKATEVIVGDRSRYQVTFIASNPEAVAGLFNVSFNTGGQKNRDDNNNLSQKGRGMDTEDISRIVFLAPREAKRIGIILDAEPRTMMINTLVAKNIPGEIELPFNEILKATGENKEFSGEETLLSMPAFSDPAEIIVDNEDAGFISSKQNTTSPLKEFLKVKNRNSNTYLKISTWNTPEYWQPVVLTSYYGKYIRSAIYTRSGSGDKSVTWKTPITGKGYYDIYCYIGKTIDRMKVKGGEQDDEGDGEGRENQIKDLHFNVYHDEGVDDITIDFEQAEGGWNNLGRFYLSDDSARVVLTNKSSGRMVIGDAVKWVKQN